MARYTKMKKPRKQVKAWKRKHPVDRKNVGGYR